MSLYCDDQQLATFPAPTPLAPKERGAPWRPPDTSSTTCTRCGKPGWQHRSHPPVLADEIDRAIYAAAFVTEMFERRRERPIADSDAYGARAIAEGLVELHRRARSGT